MLVLRVTNKQTNTLKTNYYPRSSAQPKKKKRQRETETERDTERDRQRERERPTALVYRINKSVKTSGEVSWRLISLSHI